MFSFGGFSGLLLANNIIDSLLHDSYFILGHFHYILSLAAVYTIFSTFYNYYIFLSSNFFIDIFGRIHYLLFFFSVNMIFFPFHSLGILGFPRRIVDFPIIFFRIH